MADGDIFLMALTGRPSASRLLCEKRASGADGINFFHRI